LKNPTAFFARIVAIPQEQLAPTYTEWLVGAHAGLEKIEESGCRHQKILLDVEDMIKWCKEKELPLNGASRSSYIAMKKKENDSTS
jgi:hypothetical protein